MLTTIILSALYFFLPAYCANMTPVLIRWLPFLNFPIHKKLLGPNKTWRGLIFGTVIGGLIFLLQQQLHATPFFSSIALINYPDFPFWFGFLQGFGALFGDSIKSYYKRKQKIMPGKSWFPWDQLDFVFGAIIMGGIFYFPPAETVLVLLILSPILHIIINYLGYLLKIKKNKF